MRRAESNMPGSRERNPRALSASAAAVGVRILCLWVTQYEKWVTQYENWVTQSQLGETSNLRIAQRGTLDVCQLFVRHIAHSPAGKRVSVLIRVHVSSS